MAKLLILGAGTAGTMTANLLRKALDASWSITVVDQDTEHHYQPGYLFIPFWMEPERVVKDCREFLPDGVEFVEAAIERVDPRAQQVHLADDRTLAYDWLVIATGTRPDPTLVEGMAEALAEHTTVHQFFTLEGATALKAALASFDSGRLLVHVSEMPIKCPVAPLEFAFLVEDHYRKRRLRHKVDITYVTPLDGAFTKPVASKELGGLLKDRSIRLAADFAVEKVDAQRKVLVAYDGRELPFDLLVTIPPNVGQQYVVDSGLGNDAGFIPVDKHTLRSVEHERIFVLGDASDIPTSKAGSVAHFAAEQFVGNFLAAIDGRSLPHSFDGHANCFVESGRGQALLLDFNYDTEPLKGTFPAGLIGPMKLLKPARVNHLGKLAFEQIYWNMLLPGRKLPVPNEMSMAGKHLPDAGEKE
ncbi:NAD(P)/FAD-dependent oxidoreductase [Nostocoides sp. F2B08]|uniref:type III sulfide quinone reductase, selenoprotein subtype n=1 Tax=Nostocoides sp. F2B08 TaxID=2653936 RepID=UPI0012631830|nr:FAD/NAD(P)-binding oxidoreductase [Tetrasphaera sp. F2B08]KAB7745713.1 NAD(P)/FAD-dependent oxidoreductase [Tetrasphaera sp. F2B08]